MKRASDAAVRAAFRQRMQEIKDDIAAGRIKFYNSPPEWTEQLLEVTALNCALLLLAQEAKWN
ncbi:MAG: hypothetical protein Q8O55_08335 [Dehalococcoidales bacterium]|nr:hypothetical protein [Dehalococcoidales bacterium]